MPRGGYRPGSGRPKGVTDKRIDAFRAQLRQYCTDKGVDPHWFMVDLIADPLLDDMNLKFQAAKELAQYLESKCKTVDIELSGNADKPLVLVMRRKGD